MDQQSANYLEQQQHQRTILEILDRIRTGHATAQDADYLERTLKDTGDLEDRA